MYRFKSIRGAVRYATQRNLKVGISSDRIPMIEVEHEDTLFCVYWLQRPLKVVYDDSVDTSCAKVVEEIERFLAAQVALLRHDKARHMWADQSGRVTAPIYMAVGDKSFHWIGIFRFGKEAFRQLYLLYSSEAKYVDRRYIDYVLQKGYATLRITPKVAKPVKPVFMGYLREVNTGEFKVLKYKCDVAVGSFVNKVLKRVQNMLGVDVDWC